MEPPNRFSFPGHEESGAYKARFSYSDEDVLRILEIVIVNFLNYAFFTRQVGKRFKELSQARAVKKEIWQSIADDFWVGVRKVLILIMHTIKP